VKFAKEMAIFQLGYWAMFATKNAGLRRAKIKRVINERTTRLGLKMKAILMNRCHSRVFYSCGKFTDGNQSNMRRT
jgi:hypothetical protein